MSRRMGIILGLGALLMLVGIGCLDESPTAPTTPPVFYPLHPGSQWTYQFVFDDSAQFWMNVLREQPVVVMGDTVLAMDFISNEEVTLTQYLTQKNGLAAIAGNRMISFVDTIVTVFEPPLRLAPLGTKPDESWTERTRWTELKITSSVPPDTIKSSGDFLWNVRVLGEEAVEVPAFDEPVHTLLLEFYGESDPWDPPEEHQYVWLADGYGIVQQVDLNLGRTLNRLFDFQLGK